MSAVLHVFARAPEPGRSKTRLIPRLGPAGAAALHAAFVRDTLATTRAVAGVERALAAAGDASHPLLVELARAEGIALVAQRGDDLGARMAAAIGDGLARAPRSLVIGTDSPTVTADEIARAAALLDEADVVLGPADDGGYWIVGARRPSDALFVDVLYGTGAVLATTLLRARSAGLSVALADRAFDVDEPADLDRLARALAEAPPSLAPSTRAALVQLLRGG